MPVLLLIVTINSELRVCANRTGSLDIVMVVLATSVNPKQRLASPNASPNAVMAPKNTSNTKQPQPTASDACATSTSDSPVSDDKIKSNQDKYCWLCHKDRCNASCHSCSRSYHIKCLPPSACEVNSSGRKTVKKENWLCIECELISTAESEHGKSDTMRRITVGQFCTLLRNALSTIKNVSRLL